MRALLRRIKAPRARAPRPSERPVFVCMVDGCAVVTFGRHTLVLRDGFVSVDPGTPGGGRYRLVAVAPSRGRRPSLTAAVRTIVLDAPGWGRAVYERCTTPEALRTRGVDGLSGRVYDWATGQPGACIHGGCVVLPGAA